MDKILDKLEQIAVDVAVIKNDLSRNTDDIAEHIRRTNILESRFHKILGIGLFLSGAAAVYHWDIVITFVRMIL